MSYFHISNQAPSITDWIQTCVYILTAIGLILNFWYQRRNLQEQNRLRFIEEERDRRSIMPSFEFNQTFDAIKDEVHLEFVSSEKPGKFLMVTPLTDELYPYYLINTDFKINQKNILVIPNEVIIAQSNKTLISNPIYKIEYMDKDSRPYVQELYLTGLKMFLSEPIEYRYVKMIEDRKNKKMFWPFRSKKKL